MPWRVSSSKQDAGRMHFSSVHAVSSVAQNVDMDVKSFGWSG